MSDEVLPSKRTARPVRTPRAAFRALGVGVSAFGALSIGALAIGALAVGSLAIGRLSIGRARFRKVEIDHLIVRRLDIID